MTLIALACKGDSAEFITDTASYTEFAESLGSCTKHVTMPHIDAAVLTQGSSKFAVDVKSGALQVSSQVATFDELTDSAPGWLADLWESTLEEPTASHTDSLVYLVGYSYRASAFVAYGYASEDDFEPFQVHGLAVMPAPWTARPTDIELGRFLRHPHDTPGFDQAMKTWAAKPPAAVPDDVNDWLTLAKSVRVQRALEQFGRTIVAGQVLHTRLARGRAVTRRIHEFNDSGEEFQRLIAFTQHPQALAAACHCDSGLTFAECHSAEYLIEKARELEAGVAV